MQKLAKELLERNSDRYRKYSEREREMAMKLTVQKIQKLWENGQAELVAGKEGLDREVLIYDMMEQPDIKPWLRPKMLLITTGYAVRNNKEALLELIRNLDEAGAAALAIKTRFFENFPEEALNLADRLKFPLFFLNNKSSFIEVVSPVMVAIVEAKNNIKMQTRFQIGEVEKQELDRRLFSDLVRKKIVNEEEAETRSNALYWPHLPGRVLFVGKIGEERIGDEQKKKLENYMSRLLKNFYIDYVTVQDKGGIYILIHEPETVRGLEGIIKLEKQLEDVLTKSAALGKECFMVGISEVFLEYMQMAKEVEHLKNLTEIGKHVPSSQKIFWQKDWKYEEIMLKISRNEEVRAYARSYLWKLELYDREHDSHLLHTLKTLFRNHGSRKLTAQELFLHRNTMMYRIKKIEDILECSLNDVKAVKELEFVCKMWDYLPEERELLVHCAPCTRRDG